MLPLSSLCGRLLLVCVSLSLLVAGESWTKKHMKREHHVEVFDATSFFALHDLDRDNQWTENEVRTLYGLHDPAISASRAREVVEAVFQLFNKPVSEPISKEEFVRYLESGGDLVDCEFDGHHGDDEWEFEIHHVEQFHADDERDESEWDHPEDIEHFRKHDEEHRAERQRMMDPWRNIPSKFRRKAS